MILNERLFDIPEIYTKKLTEAITDSPDVVNLARGDSEFATPNLVTEYLSRIILDDGDYESDINKPVGRWTHYEKESGSTRLINSIKKKYINEAGLSLGSSNILVTQGGMNAIFYALYTILNVGDEIIVCDPAYIAYESICSYILKGIKVCRYKLFQSENYNFDYNRLAAITNERTKALIISSPYNPCGRVYSYDELAELMEYCKLKEIFLVHDENHEKEVYDGFVHYPVSIFDKDFSNSILLNSFSRLGMGGWRIGWMVAQKRIIDAAVRVHAFVNMTCNTFVQETAAYALDNYAKLGFADRFFGYKKKRDKLVSFFNRISGIECPVPEGTCYLFPSIIEFYIKNKEIMLMFIKNSEWFVGLSDVRRNHEEMMISKWKSYVVYLYFLLFLKVGVLPGCCYGEHSDNNIRLSFSVRDEAIDEAIIRMQKLCGRGGSVE